MKFYPRQSLEQYQNEIEADNERHKQALAAFHAREPKVDRGMLLAIALCFLTGFVVALLFWWAGSR